MIKDGETLVSAKYRGSGYEIPVYDDGFGPLWISRDSMGINGIVRARTFEDAWEVCEDEFFPEATETVPELIKEYGYRIEARKVIRTAESIPECERPAELGANEKFAEQSDYSDNGRLPEGLFLRWARVETPDPDAWVENDCFVEAFGFRPSGPNASDKLNHGIYEKDLNGDSLDKLTPKLAEEIGIEMTIETEDSE